MDFNFEYLDSQTIQLLDVAAKEVNKDWLEYYETYWFPKYKGIWADFCRSKQGERYCEEMHETLWHIVANYCEEHGEDPTDYQIEDWVYSCWEDPDWEPIYLGCQDG